MNVIFFVPKKKGIDRLEDQTRGICVQSGSVKVVLWIFYYFDGDRIEECWKERQGVEESPHLGI